MVNIADIYLWSTWTVMILALLGVLGWILVKRAHDYKVRVRELTAGSVRLIEDKMARIARDEEGVEYLRVFGGKKEHRNLPLPQPEAIDYDPISKKKVVEMWFSPEIGYVFVKDGEPVQGFQPLTTKQRTAMVNQIRKKEARRTKGWKEHIPMIAGLTALVLIIAIIFIFWGEFMTPFTEATGKVDALLSRVDTILDKQAMLERGQQVIQG